MFELPDIYIIRIKSTMQANSFTNPAPAFVPAAPWIQYIKKLCDYHQSNPLTAMMCKPEDVPRAMEGKAGDGNIFWIARLQDPRINSILLDVLDMAGADTQHFLNLFDTNYELVSDDDEESLRHTVEQLFGEVGSCDLQRLVDFVTLRQENDLRTLRAAVADDTDSPGCGAPVVPDLVVPDLVVPDLVMPAAVGRCPNMDEFGYCEDADNGLCPYSQH